MKKELYVYIHIPFCYKKCPYCSFISFEKRFKEIPPYIKSLVVEIQNKQIENRAIKTIYFGGGTPNTLKLNQIERILETLSKRFTFHVDEMTIETIPVHLNKEYLKGLVSLGFNRISIGIESFRDEKLKILGRIHSMESGIKSIDNAFSSGFENINIDFIYGINDSMTTLEEELNFVEKMPVKHVSAYALSIEENTQFFQLLKKDQIDINDEETVSNLYLFLCNKLESMGFIQYEISNFSKDGFASKHNLAYWTGKEYLGLGVSAASFYKNTRTKNTEILEEYLKNPSGNYVIEEELSKQDLAKEMFILGLRLKEGIKIDDFENNYGVKIHKLFGKKLEFFKKLGLLKIQNGRIYLNGPEAMLVSNSIFCEFL